MDRNIYWCQSNIRRDDVLYIPARRLESHIEELTQLSAKASQAFTQFAWLVEQRACWLSPNRAEGVRVCRISDGMQSSTSQPQGRQHEFVQ
jgi:hypothetical protein